MDELPRSENRAQRQVNVAIVAVAESGLILVALLLAWLGLRNPAHHVWGFATGSGYASAIAWGLFGVIPMVALLLLVHWMPWRFFETFRRDTSHLVVQLFGRLSILDMAVISLLAGIGEELLFRWAIQDGLAHRMGGEYGWLIGLIFASLLFGAAHCVNFTYFALTALIGFWLGLLMLWSETWISPAIAHAFYDFIALWYLTRWLRLDDAAPQASV